MTAAAAESRCFHCGGPLSGTEHFAVCVAGVVRPVCCAGCEAAANLILAQGLSRFYEYREAPARPPGAGGGNETSTIAKSRVRNIA